MDQGQKRKEDVASKAAKKSAKKKKLDLGIVCLVHDICIIACGN
jgi:hypothetical protein